MSRVQKTNRFDSKLWTNLEQISANTKNPMSRLLDEGLEYLTTKYLMGSKPEVPPVFPEQRNIIPIVTNDPNLPDDLISVSDANRKYNISFASFCSWANKGFIKRYTSTTKSKARTFISERELQEYLVSREIEPEIKGDLIPMSEAARRFKISDSCLSDWANNGYIKKYKRPEGFTNFPKAHVFVSIAELTTHLNKTVFKEGD